ncbi:hypothetical protein PRIPAC_89174 [Pristionchus pacificus]|uniref:Uncharacterized protein n=1 Tax=Pristionchus pacificus TaxID=54126 RepID=A0A2A6B7J4_PRIPA|nr:hypothetical protein PRIPAC_89174 [Pristionchus pacificus]|eukprot:PDM61852.1 hypothetical protein PRIPAC_51294 [Pristionchus pacificus]
MIRIPTRLLIFSLIFAVLLYEGVESKRVAAGAVVGVGAAAPEEVRTVEEAFSEEAVVVHVVAPAAVALPGSVVDPNRLHPHHPGEAEAPMDPMDTRAEPQDPMAVTTTDHRGGVGPIDTTAIRSLSSGGYGGVYTTRMASGTASRTETRTEPIVSESPTMTALMVKDVLFPGEFRKPSKTIFSYEDDGMRRRYDMNGNTEKKEKANGAESAIREGLLLGMHARLQVEASKGNAGSEKALSTVKKMTEADKDEVVTVKDEQRAVLVGSIPYFWGDSNLPQGNNETDCAHFSPINNHANFTICNVTSLIRCEKSLGDITVIGRRTKSFMESFSDDSSSSRLSNSLIDVKVIVNTASGEKADDLSWFCPATDHCCEWECCSIVNKEVSEFDAPDEGFRNAVNGFFVICAIVFGILIIVVCCTLCMRHEAMKQQAAINRRGQRQQVRERQPLTATFPKKADYPRQPPIQHQGNYGWNNTPSAPPAMNLLSRRLLLFMFNIFILLNDKVGGTSGEDRALFVMGFSPMPKSVAPIRNTSIGGNDENRYSWSTRYYGGNFTATRMVTYYNGGAYGSVYSIKTGPVVAKPNTDLQPIASERPTVTTEMIKDVLFPGKFRKPSKALFHVENNYNLKRWRFDMKGNVEGTAKNDINIIELEKQGYMKEEVAVIFSTVNPVLVKSVPYFWGNDSLPILDNDCADVSPINLQRVYDPDFEICNTTLLKICQRSLGDIPVIGRMKESPLTFMRRVHSRSWTPPANRVVVYDKNGLADIKVQVKKADGDTADELSWFCPSSHRCCEWECCSFVKEVFVEYQKPDKTLIRWRPDEEAVAVVAEAVVEVDRVAEEAAVVVHEEVQAVVASLPPGEVDRNPPPHGEVEAPLDRAVTVHLEALMDRMGPVEARIVVPITDHREDRIAIDIMETPTSLCERTLTTGSMAGHARTCRYRSFWGGDGYGGGYITRSGPTLSGTAPVKQQAPSESPTITTKTIREVLFPHGVPSKEVFDFEDNEYRVRYDEDGNVSNQMDMLKTYLEGLKSRKQDPLDRLGKAFLDGHNGKDEEATIKDEESPVLIGSIPYFWGDENLPNRDNETDCTDFSPINSPSNFTICNMTSLIWCQKSLSEAIVVGKKKPNRWDEAVDNKIIVKNGNGTIANEFAWFCPPSEQCCEWECCGTEEKKHTETDPPDEQFISMVHALIIFAIIFITIIACCICCRCMSKNESIAVARTPQQRRQTVEMQPLTADYPKQQPSSSPRARYVPLHRSAEREQPMLHQPQPGGNIGWSVTPSAPPAYEDIKSFGTVEEWIRNAFFLLIILITIGIVYMFCACLCNHTETMNNMERTIRAAAQTNGTQSNNRTIVNTAIGDYPRLVPQRPMQQQPDTNTIGWSLLMTIAKFYAYSLSLQECDYLAAISQLNEPSGARDFIVILFCLALLAMCRMCVYAFSEKRKNGTNEPGEYGPVPFGGPRQHSPRIQPLLEHHSDSADVEAGLRSSTPTIEYPAPKISSYNPNVFANL